MSAAIRADKVTGATAGMAPGYVRGNDPVPVGDDELPVFWACGVTPQAAIENARPPLCITYAPGCIVITDLLNCDVAAS